MHVAIAGAGIGGMTLAALLHRTGHTVELVEKADAFGEVGAGIQISPNGSRILAEIGLADDLARIGTTPGRIVMRRWEDDLELMVLPLGNRPFERYGFGYYNVYRPDLVDILATALEGVNTRLGTEVAGARHVDGGAALVLADGSSIEADLVVGADGIHSAVRTSMFEATEGRFSKFVAHRALVPREAVAHLPVEVSNRVGPQKHVVSYFVGEGQRYFNLVCVVPESDWDVEGWNVPGSADDLRAHFAGWAPALGEVLEHVIEPVHRWALYDRVPLRTWINGRVALLGDSCHPMLPFMAQGACQAMEDAAILSRALHDAKGTTGVDDPLATYQRVRRPRTTEIQNRSWDNATHFHMSDGPEQQARDEFFQAISGHDDTDPFEWLSGYDALTIDY